MLNDLLHEILPYITPILTFVFGTVLYVDISRRKKIAEAKKLEADNITSYAGEWKELYEQKVQLVNQLNEKIDKLYDYIEELRQKLHEIEESKVKIEIDSIKKMAEKDTMIEILEVQKCKLFCEKRIPPSKIYGGYGVKHEEENETKEEVNNETES